MFYFKETLKSKKKKRTIDAKKVCYVLYYLMVFGLVLLGTSVVRNPDVSNILVIVAVIMGTIATAQVCFREDSIRARTILQLCGVYFVVLLFWILTLISTLDKYIVYYEYSAYSILLCLTVSFVLCLIAVWRKLPWMFKRIKAICGRNKWLFVLLLLFVLCYASCYSYLFKSDSNTYYRTLLKGIGAWDFSFSNLECFQLGYHKTYGYSLFAFIGEYLFPQNAIGLRTINLCMYLVTTLIVYFIVRKMTQYKSVGIALIAAGVFSFNPLILGLAQEVSTDMPLTCFFVWVVFAGMYDLNIFFVFSSYLLCFSKEIGVMLYAFYMLGRVICRFVPKFAKKKDLFVLFDCVKGYEWASLFGPLLFVYQTLWGNDTWGQESGLVEKQLGLLNTFQINPEYIIIKLQQFFLLNFQWLFWGIVFSFLIYCLANKYRIKSSIVIREDDWGILGAGLSFWIFNLFYFTYPHARYLMPTVFFNAIILVFLWNNLDKKKLFYGMCIGLIIIQFVQTYVQLDPVQDQMFRQVSTGNGNIASLAYYNDKTEVDYVLISGENGADLSSEVFRDYVQTNRSYTRFVTAFENVLKDIEYTENDAIYLAPIYRDYDLDYTIINMFGTDYKEELFWDTTRKQITYESSADKINWLEYGFELEECEFDSVWYIYLPFAYAEPEEVYYSDDKELPSPMEYDYAEWKLVVYKLK